MKLFQFNFLPQDIITKIFSYLSNPNLVVVTLVCKLWRDIFQVDLFWKIKLIKEFKISPTFQCKNWKLLYQERQKLIRTFEEGIGQSLELQFPSKLIQENSFIGPLLFSGDKIFGSFNSKLIFWDKNNGTYKYKTIYRDTSKDTNSEEILHCDEFAEGDQISIQSPNKRIKLNEKEKISCYIQYYDIVLPFVAVILKEAKIIQLYKLNKNDLNYCGILEDKEDHSNALTCIQFHKPCHDKEVLESLFGLYIISGDKNGNLKIWYVEDMKWIRNLKVNYDNFIQKNKLLLILGTQ